jgi:hypothetical protein
MSDNKSMAERNGTFWAVDKDGVIKEAEYLEQGSKIGKRN